MNKRDDGPHGEREMGVGATTNRVETVVKEGNLWNSKYRQRIIDSIVRRCGRGGFHLGNVR